MRSVVLLALALAACGDVAADSSEIAYEGGDPLDPLVEESPNDLSDRSALANYSGLYGATYADCDPANERMDEYIELFDQGFAYRGEMATLAEIIDQQNFRFSDSEGEAVFIRFNGERLILHPDERAFRTIYLRCP